MNWKLTLILVGLLCPIFSFSQICDNVTTGGEIDYDQTLCSPGEDPAELVSLSLPTGGSGDLEYIWISTTSNPTMMTTVWDIIVGSTGESYDPGPLFETTYFRRCARRFGCTQYIGESNILRICVDVEAPQFTSVLMDGVIDCNESPTFDTPTYSDDCDMLVGYFFTDDTLQNGCTTSYIRTFTIVDDCGKTAETTQTITTTDNEAPVITLNPPNQDIMDGDTLTMECGMVNVFTSTDATATDNCDDNPMITFSDSVQNGDCLTDGFLRFWTCSWTAKDACGNVSTFTVYAKIVDTTNPFFTEVPADATIDCTEMPVFGTPVFEDSCDEELTLEMEEDTMVDGCTTTYTKTWTITDDCGNNASATQTITTTDDEAPVIVLNAPNQDIMNGDTLIAECDNLMLLTSGDASVTDNCDDAPLLTFSDNVDNGDCIADGFLQFWTCTWTAKDDCGNTSTFTVYMRVVDTTPPMFTFVPESETIECLDAPDFGTPIYEDNCDDDLTLDMTTDTLINGCTIVYSIIWKISDDCGNNAVATQTITAIDNTAPTLTLGSLMDGDTIVADCGDIPFFDEFSIGVSDNCDAFPITTFEMGVEFGDCLTDGYLRIMSRSWTAVDACGNMASLTIYIRVVDTAAPMIVLDGDFSDVMSGDTIVAECDNVPVLLSNSAIFIDNCDDELLTTFTDDFINGSCIDDGFILFNTYTYTAEDDCSNATTFIVYIKVVDTTVPIFINVPDDETIQCDETPVFGIPTFSDNCDSDLTETVTQDTFYSACSTEFVRTWTITDDCGNSTSASQFIWAIDNVAPTLSLNAPFENIESGDTLIAECDALPFFDINSVTLTDNCDTNPTLSFDVIGEPGDCPVDGHLYVATITWEAADACGNMTTFTLAVRVVDTTAPTFVSVPDITVASCDDPLIIDGLAIATDNCTSMVGVTFTIDTLVSFEDIKYQINWTAKDDCQNSADTLQVVTVPCNAAFLFTHISGGLMGNTVLVNWIGLNEYDSGVYNLQRSKDGVDFQFLNSPIPAEGVIRDFVDYASWDASPYEGHNYYRVQYVDERGRLTYSEVIRVDLPTITKVKIFPNPASDYIIVELNDFSTEAVIVDLHARNGLTLQTYHLDTGINSLQIPLSDLHTGMYFITVKGENTRQRALRFIKSD